MSTRIKFARSARRHKIGYAHAMFVIRANPPVLLKPQPPHNDIRWGWVGPDDRGIELEIIAAWMPDARLVVIHLMPTALRKRTS